MTCRRAQEIDLLEFLNAPQRADFENFRQHYPRCPDCSAELRTWTELHETLNDGGSAPAHPDPEELEQFDRAPDTLPVRARATIEGHLAGCAACRDELHVLRAQVPGRIPGPAAPPAKREPLWRSFTRVVWHPAFAYALVGVLLFPLLYREWGTIRGLVPPPAAQSPAPAAPRDHPAEPPAVPAAKAGAKGSTSPARLPAPEAKAQAEATERQRSEPAQDKAEARDADFRARAATPTPDPAGTSGVAENDLLASEALEETPLYRGVRTREIQGAMADLHERDIYVPTLRLHRGTLSRAPEKELEAGVLLEVPLPRDQPGGWARVWVSEEFLATPDPKASSVAGRQAAPAGESGVADDPRSFDEARAVEPLQRALVVHVPPRWMRPGRYRVDLELRDGHGGEVIGRGRYRLQVD